MVENRKIVDSKACLEFGLNPAEVSYLEEYLGQWPEPMQKRLINKYFKDQLNPYQAVKLLTTREKITARELVALSLADCFFEMIKLSLPHLQNPDFYAAQDAVDVCRLYQQLRHFSAEGNGGEDPFSSVVSVRHLSKMSGLLAPMIAEQAGNTFLLGSLSLEMQISLPAYSSVVKKAIHDSVLYSEGRARLHTVRIDGNEKRIAKTRRMIGVTPSLANGS